MAIDGTIRRARGGASRARRALWARATLATLVLAVVAQGCVSVSYVDGTRIPTELLPRIQPGVTTKAEVLDLFGAPQGFSDANVLRKLLDEMDVDVGDPLELPFSDVLVFQHVRGTIRATTLVVYSWFDIRTAADTLVIFFDVEDRVTYYGFREGTRAIDEASEN